MWQNAIEFMSGALILIKANARAIQHLCYGYGGDHGFRFVDDEEGGLAGPVRGAAEGSGPDEDHDKCEDCAGVLSDERPCNSGSG